MNSRDGGVGLQLGPIDGKAYSLGGIDLDTCRNSITDTVEHWALEVLARVSSYAEISPSGSGIKIFFLYRTEDLPELRTRMATQFGRQFKHGTGEHPPAIEVHLGNRYFVVTGMHVSGTPTELRMVNRRTLVWLLTDFGPALIRSSIRAVVFKGGAHFNEIIQTMPIGIQDVSLPRSIDGALLTKLQKAIQRRPKLGARWNGSTVGLNDSTRSGMDMSMTTLLHRAGFSFEETKSLLTHWPYGAGSERVADERYFRRMWERQNESR